MDLHFLSDVLIYQDRDIPDQNVYDQDLKN